MACCHIDFCDAVSLMSQGQDYLDESCLSTVCSVASDEHRSSHTN